MNTSVQDKSISSKESRRLGSYRLFRQKAVARLGDAEVSRREQAADDKAIQVRDDPTCFAEDEDRDDVRQFCQSRFRQMAMRFDDFRKFEEADHGDLFVFMCHMVEEGEMI